MMEVSHVTYTVDILSHGYIETTKFDTLLTEDKWVPIKVFSKEVEAIAFCDSIDLVPARVWVVELLYTRHRNQVPEDIGEDSQSLKNSIEDECEHEWYSLFDGCTNVGKECRLCNKQEWY